MSYQKKYLIYKSKYLKLKNLLGGNGKYTGDLVGMIKKGHGTMIYPEGSEYKEYTGSWDFDKRYGNGKMIYADGAIYDGIWVDDNRHNKGCMIYADGSKYDGLWVDDRHGMGIMIYPDGSVYNGMWVNDMKHGSGVIDYANGSKCRGKWINDNIINDCVIEKKKRRYKDGSVYDGFFSNNMKSGKGIMIFNDNSVYDGMWDTDMKSGFGRMVYSDSSVYEGMWSNDMRNGSGRLTEKDGTVYEGIWENNRRFDEDYEIVIFIMAHGCDKPNANILQFIEEIKETIDPLYLGFGNHGCSVWRHREEKFREMYNIFSNNNKTDVQLKKSMEEIITQSIKYHKPMKKDDDSLHIPEFDHIYFLHNKKEKFYDATNVDTGIFMIKNNMGLPNINLFDWDTERYINKSNGKQIERLSIILAKEIYKVLRGKNYHKQINLANIIGAFSKWFTSLGKDRKLKLIIIDSSCRGLCSGDELNVD